MLRCANHKYRIAKYDTYTFQLLPKIYRPSNDCADCWRRYYFWFAAKHPDELSAEIGECEQWRDKTYLRSRRRRVAPKILGIDDAERASLKSLGLSERWIEDYSRRTMEAQLRNFPGVLGAGKTGRPSKKV
jgi:hypothetical protein